MLNAIAVMVTALMIVAWVVSYFVIKKEKTVMYKLVWKKEVIEEHIEGIEEAEFLAREYAIAYSGYVQIVKEK